MKEHAIDQNLTVVIGPEENELNIKVGPLGRVLPDGTPWPHLFDLNEVIESNHLDGPVSKDINDSSMMLNQMTYLASEGYTCIANAGICMIILPEQIGKRAFTYLQEQEDNLKKFDMVVVSGTKKSNIGTSVDLIPLGETYGQFNITEETTAPLMRAIETYYYQETKEEESEKAI